MHFGFGPLCRRPLSLTAWWFFFFSTSLQCYSEALVSHVNFMVSSCSHRLWALVPFKSRLQHIHATHYGSSFLSIHVVIDVVSFCLVFLNSTLQHLIEATDKASWSKFYWPLFTHPVFMEAGLHSKSSLMLEIVCAIVVYFCFSLHVFYSFLSHFNSGFDSIHLHCLVARSVQWDQSGLLFKCLFLFFNCFCFGFPTTLLFDCTKLSMVPMRPPL